MTEDVEREAVPDHDRRTLFLVHRPTARKVLAAPTGAGGIRLKADAGAVHSSKRGVDVPHGLQHEVEVQHVEVVLVERFQNGLDG